MFVANLNTEVLLSSLYVEILWVFLFFLHIYTHTKLQFLCNFDTELQKLKWLLWHLRMDCVANDTSTEECSYVFFNFQDENSCKRNVFCLNMTNYSNSIFLGMNVIKIKLDIILIFFFLIIFEDYLRPLNQ